MNSSIGIIGGADGPTAIFVTGSVGQTVLTVFAALLAVLALLVLAGRRRRRYLRLAPPGAVLVVLADQCVKALTVGALAQGETAPLLPGLLRLERVHNYGAAWSSFSGERWLLIAVTAVGLGALVYLAVRIVRHPLGVWALWLVVGGGVGNLLDRVRLGYVVDMLAAEFINFPVFNVADIFVTCGTVAAAVYYLAYYEKYDAKNWENANDGAHTADNGRG
ncbi:MAG: signal peptidase II [Oscillospiraceae bacterium]|nr:signal peptidase II [Oscillospiraceae bacterium]